MRAEEFQSFVTRRPFQPFRITLTDGRTYDVRHPELAMTGRSIVALGIPSPAPAADTNGEETPIFDRLVTISLNHVMQIELLEQPATS